MPRLPPPPLSLPVYSQLFRPTPTRVRWTGQLAIGVMAVVWLVSRQGRAVLGVQARKARGALLPSPSLTPPFLSCPALPWETQSAGAYGPRFVPNSCLRLRACVLLNENKSDAYCDA